MNIHYRGKAERFYCNICGLTKANDNHYTIIQEAKAYNYCTHVCGDCEKDLHNSFCCGYGETCKNQSPVV